MRACAPVHPNAPVRMGGINSATSPSSSKSPSPFLSDASKDGLPRRGTLNIRAINQHDFRCGNDRNSTHTAEGTVGYDLNGPSLEIDPCDIGIEIGAHRDKQNTVVRRIDSQGRR